MASLTRSAKNELVTRRDLDRAWRQTADAFGFARVRTVTRADADRPLTDPPGNDEILARLTEFDATFRDRDARAVAFEASAGASIQDTLNRLEQLRDTDELLALADGLETTRAHRRAERETAGLATRVATRRVKSMPSMLVADQALALDAELKARSGAGLSPAQRDAFELACSDAQLTVIEGQAGTGKSTVLAGVARAHQAAGQEIVVTSTAALAAGRLSADLEAAGVDASSYSTAALHTAIDTGRLELTRETTVIHDEAALASTREIHQLLAAVEESGARLILIGDPKQSQAVGAGGLWPRIERAARENGARIELTENLRAKDPNDRNAQKLFRDGHYDQALRDYHRRGRVSLQPDQRRAEDSALEAAHADRQAGKHSLVMAQTSNDHLDELNARAQAIRDQHRELGAESVPVPGRPYQLHAGDEVQIRRNLTHPTHGRLRNGTAGHVTRVDVDRQALVLHLDSGQRVMLKREQINQADLRLSYVQHPFPAQGQTSDTAHLIVADHATQEGSYVAITRSREQTHIHARQPEHYADQPLEPVAELADRMGRAEPGIPSIDTPLAHEHAITTDPDAPGHHAPPGDEPAIDLRSASRAERRRPAPPEHLAVLGEPPADSHPDRQTWETAAHAIERYRTQYSIDPGDLAALGPEPSAGNFQQRHERTHAAGQVHHALDRLGRHVPQTALARERSLDDPELDGDQHEHDHTPRWEP